MEMARGWESKAVAEQIEEGKQHQPRESASPTHAQERQRVAALESFRLSRSRLLEQLEKAHHPSYREVLLKGLGAIEQQIEDVSAEKAGGRAGPGHEP
jgi:hypothetical protein